MSSIYLANFKPALTSVTFLADSSPAELYTYWSYSLNGGSYVPFYEGSTYRANCTITGLTEGTTYTVKVRAYLSGVGTLYYTTTYSFSTLKNQTPPTVTASVSSVTHNSFNVTGTANYTCKTWQYQLNGGTWTSLSTSSSATQVSKAITGLAPGTAYAVRIRATRTYNNVTGTSGTVNTATLGASVLNSVNTVVADDETVSVNFNWTVQPGTGFTNTLRIKDGGTLVVEVTGLTGASGARSVNLTSGQRDDLLFHMRTVKSFAGTFELETLDGATRVGSLSSKTATVTTTEANSKPTFTGFTHSEENTTIASVITTEDYYVKNQSDIKIVCNAATAKNGASLSKYVAKIGSTSVSSTTTTIAYGAPTVCGNPVAITVYAEDSRGYQTTVSKNVSVKCYYSPQVVEWKAARKDSVGEITSLDVMVRINSYANYGVDVVQYRIRETGGSYGSWTNLTPIVYSHFESILGGSRFYTYSDSEWRTNLDPNKSYQVQLRVRDNLLVTSSSVTFTIARGTPLVSFRDGKVGINQPNPQAGLDVQGDTYFDGKVFADTIGVGKIPEAGRALDVQGPVYFDGIQQGIVESGSNANGKWVQFADGTMICYHITSVSNFTLQHTLVDNIGFNYYSWEYPCEFYSTPHVTVGRAQVGTGAQWGSSRQNTYSTAQLVVWGVHGSAGTLAITMQAIGRWKA